ncbi:hypothetical protein LEP1GSC116_4781 [Leptospira interrogans serovar Icterohaemorrhagiae str. Verdun HP]|uniref:Uncharacterized protein n=1 Tax=Leptospira interrogans serovar Icterohaemorrhagiae str. Verdun HP TaxID=1049910 RepID=M6RLV8_LEPIR|nr:hypothetical protein LEP1GSC116_4781 [Leptospira interrogans serovar Icterohaemorrhagiae str. Verdun HP]
MEKVFIILEIFIITLRLYYKNKKVSELDYQYIMKFKTILKNKIKPYCFAIFLGIYLFSHEK